MASPVAKAKEAGVSQPQTGKQNKKGESPFTGRLLDGDGHCKILHDAEFSAKKKALETIVEGANFAKLAGNYPRAIALLEHAIDEVGEWPDNEGWQNAKAAAMGQMTFMMNNVVLDAIRQSNQQI